MFIVNYLRTLFGRKDRYADIVAIDKKTGEIKEIHQIGKQNENGTPYSRERDATDDIEKATGKNVIFTAYNFILIITVALSLVSICVFYLLTFSF